MFRAVLAVVVASALLAVALPAVDGARTGNADRAVQGELLAVERAAASMLAADETTPGDGARRTVAVTLPVSSWGREGVESLTIHGGGQEGPPPRRGRVRYRLDGRSEREATVEAPLSTPEGPVVLRGPGPHRLVLELVRVEGRRVILVSVADAGGNPARDAPRTGHRRRSRRLLRMRPRVRGRPSGARRDRL